MKKNKLRPFMNAVLTNKLQKSLKINHYNTCNVHAHVHVDDHSNISSYSLYK